MNGQEAKLHTELDRKILELFQKLSPQKKAECLQHMETTHGNTQKAGR